MSITMGQLASKFQTAAQRVPSASQQGLKTLAQVGVGIMKREIQAVHAVDTGSMLNNTEAEKINATTWLVGPTVEYAVFVALGTSRVRARPFHISAAKELEKQVKDFDFDIKKLGL